MNERIPVAERPIGGVLQPTVDGRALWAFFRPRNQFANWIRAKLLQHHFIEGIDFERVYVDRMVNDLLHPRISRHVDYVMSVSMAERIGEREFCRGPIPWA